ncbi:Hint domain-containing protein [Pelagovum pacificum]|uniref:Hint domain-containing protein n=1 Tax=Pelagovum pacificum TaxID=2588711 RepID=A0A5C5GBS2_9RHOB|nr:Hint domain-containing protein [Pelagovum pacificum]QQA44795.1 Hint domain-containing protein [Pelagovum pacificum]TNY32098.1 Hint domain-containing protein [Pelagovum pacificum]
MTAHFADFSTDLRVAPTHGQMSFAGGTYIATPRGEVRIEELSAGDRVFTRDSGLQVVRWTGTATVAVTCAEERPVIVRAGALGHNLPENDLILAPFHRVLLSGDVALEMFGDSEVLIEARHLTFLDGIERADVAEVTYHHILFDKHEVVLSNGAWTESFQPAAAEPRGVEAACRDALLALFPALVELGQGFEAARRVVVPAR